MHDSIELDEFMQFGKSTIHSAELNERGLVLTREDGETLAIRRYASSNRGIPGIDAEAAETIAAVLGIKDSKSRKIIAEAAETYDEVIFKVTSSFQRRLIVEITTKTAWDLAR